MKKELIGTHYFLCHCKACSATFKYGHEELTKDNRVLSHMGKYIYSVSCPKCKHKNLHTDSQVIFEKAQILND